MADDQKPNPEMELVETGLGKMERWRARAIGIGMTSAQLARADDARQDAASNEAGEIAAREAEERELQRDGEPLPGANALRGGGPQDEDCEEERQEEDREDAGSLKMAKAVVGRGDDPGEGEPSEEDEPEVDPEEQALREVLAELVRLDGRMTALESSRAERLALDAEIAAAMASQRDQTPPTPEKPLPALPSLPN
jgi:hypothetical protein